jgi:hypothetical protein
MKVLIWSFEHNGWWAARENGYVENAADAGLYDLERAIQICTGAVIADCNEAIVMPPPYGERGEAWQRPPNVKDFPRADD